MPGNDNSICDGGIMTDVTFRLSGGVTPEYTVEEMRSSGVQVIPQGIGFPDAPVSNVPSEELDDVLNSDSVATGLFMSWMGPWVEGLFYPRGSVVAGDGWQMVANTLTLEYPFPQSNGAPSYGLPSFTPATQNSESTVASGHKYTFSTSGWLTSLRVWVPATGGNINYRVLIVDVTDPAVPVTSVIEDPTLTAGQWTNLAFGQRLVPSGTILNIVVEALNSGGDTIVTGGWAFLGNSSGQPSGSGWNKASNNTSIRSDRRDLDRVDRYTELLGIVQGSTMQYVQTSDPDRSVTWRVNSTTDFGNYVGWGVTLIAEGPAGQPTVSLPSTLTATIPVAQPTEYSEQAGSVPTPTWATVTGILLFDGVDQTGDTNSYGTDVQFQPGAISADWDAVSFTSI